MENGGREGGREGDYWKREERGISKNCDLMVSGIKDVVDINLITGG